MAEEKGFGSTVMLVGAGVVGLVLVSNSFKPKPNAPITAPTAEAAPAGVPDWRYQMEAEKAVKARLKDPGSAQFSDVHVSRRSGAPVVCGTVNGRNSFGGMTGPQRFVSGSVTALEEDMKAGEMEQLWPRVC